MGSDTIWRRTSMPNGVRPHFRPLSAPDSQPERSLTPFGRRALEDPEVRDRVQVVLAGVVDDPVERTVRLNPQTLVDLPECQIVTAAGLVAAGVRQPRLDADALHQRRRLPGRRRPGCGHWRSLR